MKTKAIKVHWQDEELDRYYRKNGYPKKVWKDNEGMPLGIYIIEIGEDDFESVLDCYWYSTEEQRDKAFKAFEEEA